MLRAGIALTLVLAAVAIAAADDLAQRTGTAAIARAAALSEPVAEPRRERPPVPAPDVDASDVADTDPDLVPDPLVGAADLVEGDETPGMVAFTFDDGPEVGLTDHILDALVAYDIPGAFFIVGKHLDSKRTDHAVKAARLVQRELSLGFLVGNHTYGHAHVTVLDNEKMAWQIDHTTKQLRATTGRAVGLFRPPYGHLSERTEAFLKKRGLTPVKWNLDSRDWEGATSEEMRKKALQDIRRKNGGIILFHDTKKVTARTIEAIFDDLEAYNCKRLAAGKSIIQPVSLHYFLRDGGKRRKVPPPVAQQTAAYRAELPARCDARGKGSKLAHR
jgi:peptidoglycan/xylan/chitin deacetylase (PgdA/CDA1 family)